MTLDDIADAVWTYITRTLDGLAPPGPDGSALDAIAYAVWTYVPRTVDAPVAGDTINWLPYVFHGRGAMA
jgi:hypothetical protein